MSSIKYIEQDLKTFSVHDLKCMYKYYKVNNIKNLATKLARNRKTFLPAGTIWDAINSNDYNNVLEFVNDSDFNPDEISSVTGYEGETLLTFALYQKYPKNIDINIIKVLINKGVDINKGKHSPLMMAILNNDTDMADILLKAGADPNKPDNLNHSAMYYALMNEDEEKVRLLLDYGFQVSLKELIELRTYGVKIPYKIFAEYGSLDSFINKNNRDNIIIKNYSYDRIKVLKEELDLYLNVFSPLEKEYLLKNCPKTESPEIVNRIYVLMKCVEKAQEMYKYHPSNENAGELIEKYKEHSYFQKKASFSGSLEKLSRDSNGISFKASLPEGTIWNAIDQNNYENFLEFVNDPSFDKNTMFKGDTLLTFVITRNNIKNRDKYIQKLIDKGVDVNKPSNTGSSPLILSVIFHYHIKHDTIPDIELLLKAGADPNAKTLSGINVIRFAISKAAVSPLAFTESELAELRYILELLLDYGAKITPRALEIACRQFSQYKDTFLLDMLLVHGDLPDLDLSKNINDKCNNYIIEKLKTRLDPYFEVFSPREVEYLKSECDLNTVSGIYKCIDMAENMYKYHPSNENAEKLGEKYKTHPYFKKDI